MTSLWPSQELLLSSVSSPLTPFYTSAAGMTSTLTPAVCLFVQSAHFVLQPVGCAQGRCRGTVAAFPGRAGGGVRPPRAQEAHPANADLVRGHPPPRPLHP